MYERFTDRARKVMQLANQEAQRFNHKYISTEHILLGLVKEGSGVAANVLKNLDIDARKVRLEVEKIMQSGPDTVTMGKLPQTPRAKKVIEYSIEEARNLNHNYVGTEHLLLGLLREQEGVAVQVLTNLGLRVEDVRAEVYNLLGHSPNPPEVESTKGDKPATPFPASRDLEALFDRLQERKEAAVSEGDFQKAAQIRDLVDLLKREISYLPLPHESRKLFKEYDLYIPLHYNDVAPVEPEKLARIRQHLMDQFGGFIDFRHRIEGAWKVANVTFHDEVIVYRVVVGEGKGDREFFLRLKEQLKADLRQENILITVQTVYVV